MSNLQNSDLSFATTLGYALTDGPGATLSGDRVVLAVEKTVAKLTESEHRLLVMQFKLGSSLEEIASALRLKSRQAAEARLKSLLRVFELYLHYFARYDHDFVDAHLEEFVGFAALAMRTIFDGRKSGKRLTNSYKKITDDNIAGFIELVAKLSRYKRT